VLAEGENPRNTYTITATITIPEAKYGANYIQLIRYGADDMISFQFNVKPIIAVETSKVTVGGSIVVKGMGFPVEDEGTVIMDGIEPGIDFVADDIGSFSVEYQVPEIIAGTHKFVATSENLIVETVNTTFSVDPILLLSPENPPVGSEAQLTGHGFAANSQMNIVYNTVQLSNPPVTDSKGSFDFKFKVIESSDKAPIITATDKAGNTTQYGMPLESTAPPKPFIISPKERDQTFGMMGSQLVTFQWSPVSDPSGVTYTIEVGDNLEFFPLKPGMRRDGLASTSVTLEIPPGLHFWRVRAVDGAGNEGEWAMSPNFFKVGSISLWYLLVGGAVILVVFIFLVRAFVTRLRDYYR